MPPSLSYPPNETGKNDWTAGDNKIGRLDYSLNAGIHYRFLRVFFVTLQCEYGLAKTVCASGHPDRRWHKNRTLSLLRILKRVFSLGSRPS
jgi:hypothetical protein